MNVIFSSQLNKIILIEQCWPRTNKRQISLRSSEVLQIKSPYSPAYRRQACERLWSETWESLSDFAVLTSCSMMSVRLQNRQVRLVFVKLDPIIPWILHRPVVV